MPLCRQKVSNLSSNCEDNRDASRLSCGGAIALQPNQPRRQQLAEWLQTLSQPAATPPKPLYAVGQVVKVKLPSWADWLEGKISRIVEGVGTNLRVLITEPCFFQWSEVSVFSSEVIAPI